MKKLAWLFLGCFYAASSLAGTNLEFENKKIIRDDPQNHVSIEVNFPQIKSPTQRSESVFNGKTQQSAQAIVENFKNMLAKNMTNPLPPDLKAQGSYLKVSYDLTTLEPKQWVSLRFFTDSYQVGAAHPSHIYSTLNYDLTRNKVITLKDLLKSKAFTGVATISAQKAKEHLKASGNDSATVFNEGLTPTLQNYAAWNITPQGIRITFNEYQIVAYTYGPQEILLPFADVQGYLADDTGLAKCLVANNCTFGAFSTPK
jgi:hypothetical protein